MFRRLAPVLPSNITAFVATCAAIGQQAQCCTLPVVSFLLLIERWDDGLTRLTQLGQALICESPP